MADYGCCLWTSSPELDSCRTEGSIDAAKLGLSADLVARLRAWHQDWEEMAYSTTGFSSPAAGQAWKRRGWEFAQELQSQLGPDFRVSCQGNDEVQRPVLDGAL